MAHVYFLDWPLPALQMACADYAAATFDVAAFAQQGIALPRQIATAARQRQADFFHGRLCARAALRRLSAESQQVGIGMQRQPLWPEGVAGSISHNAGMAAAIALQGWRGVGLDIEPIFDANGAATARAVAASENEQRYLASLEATLGPWLPLTLLFSAKESFYKAVHGDVGHYFDFDAIRLEHLDPAAQHLDFRIDQHLSPQWPTGSRCRVHYQHINSDLIATLCLWRQ